MASEYAKKTAQYFRYPALRHVGNLLKPFCLLALFCFSFLLNSPLHTLILRILPQHLYALRAPSVNHQRERSVAGWNPLYFLLRLPYFSFLFSFSLFPAFSPLLFPRLSAPSSFLHSPLCHPPSPTFRSELILFHLYSRFPSPSHPIHLHSHLTPFPLLPSLRSSGVHSRISQVG